MIHESALRTRVGDRAAVRAQLAHFLEASERPPPGPPSPSPPPSSPPSSTP
ncbi:Scr1 family TA system antitoxin-like transcriptional regulator [Streptomyces sp. INA 01156]